MGGFLGGSLRTHDRDLFGYVPDQLRKCDVKKLACEASLADTLFPHACSGSFCLSLV